MFICNFKTGGKVFWPSKHDLSLATSIKLKKLALFSLCSFFPSILFCDLETVFYLKTKFCLQGALLMMIEWAWEFLKTTFKINNSGLRGFLSFFFKEIIVDTAKNKLQNFAALRISCSYIKQKSFISSHTNYKKINKQNIEHLRNLNLIFDKSKNKVYV